MLNIGKYLIIIGAIILIAGILISYFPRLNFFGRLPGDIVVKKENFSLYIPIVTSIVLSVLLTFLFWIISYFTRK